MVVVPVAIPVTSPVALIVATLVLLLLQVPPVEASESCVVAPVQTAVLPLIAATTGKAFTVMVTLFVVAQPLLLVVV